MVPLKFVSFRVMGTFLSECRCYLISSVEKFSAGLITAVLSSLTLAVGSLAGAREGRVDDTVQYSVLPHLLLLWMNADNNLFA